MAETHFVGGGELTSPEKIFLSSKNELLLIASLRFVRLPAHRRDRGKNKNLDPILRSWVTTQAL
jgi:hypothetical protein